MKNRTAKNKKLKSIFSLYKKYTEILIINIFKLEPPVSRSDSLSKFN